MAPPDELLLERLDAFMEKTIAEMQAFACRENIPVSEVRRHVAERHCKYLFESDTEALGSVTERRERVQEVLVATSRAVESLNRIAGLQAMLLVVDPSDPDHDGFLGGTELGREFWRGMRGGGATGTKAFKAHAVAARHSTSPIVAQTAAFPLKRETAHQVKADVYAAVRNALRSASGVRNADMKWTNHDNLNVYGVRVVGWPVDIPKQNPSSLSSSQNRALREALEAGTLRFCKIQETIGRDSEPASSSRLQASAVLSGGLGAADLSWAITDGPYITVIASKYFGRRSSDSI
ncbi:hypothetical protein FA95DRAFT_1537571 [Auriscalpium vulgare]|uniref:Uncharacterized protein n=1 Tax=Auriscalpium vulgare TaxID=40419 RepID=A0ACB8S104_9AGAM|nr:hypothetical protein FA95DRAFT_1537571 [Auriscalpium vulgare]